MRYQMFIASHYVAVGKIRAKKAITDTKERIVENKSELICIAGTAVVVGLTARVAGFQAGYEFANTN